jgi:hypothetical protein
MCFDLPVCYIILIYKVKFSLKEINDMDYILEADIYEGCNQLNMLEYSLECIGIDENEFVNEGANIKEKIKNIGKTVLGWIDSARGFLKKILDFVFRKSKVADAAYESAEKKAEQAADNMDKATPEQAESKAAKTVSNIMRITTNLNKQIEMKDKEIEKSGSDTDNTDTKSDAIPITKGNVSKTDTNTKPGRCSVKTINTQKVGDFLASAQQEIHSISSCAHDMDKIFKLAKNTDSDKLIKKDSNFNSKMDVSMKARYIANPAREFLEDEVYTIEEISKGKRRVHKEIIQVINNNKKYIDSVQDRLEKIINQSDKELSNVRGKVNVYRKELEKMVSESKDSSYTRAYTYLCDSFIRLRLITISSNKSINRAAQFVIKYKVTLAGYLSAIAAGSSSEAA